METLKIGILGYGNIGKGVAKAAAKMEDMELAAIITRRDPESLKETPDNVPVINVRDVEGYKDKIDVLILCGGSATDLPVQGPEYAAMFNTVDSFDTHARIPEYFEKVNNAAIGAEKTSVIATGWDPGLFSMMRVIEEAVLPEGSSYTFWGKGVSQGHSDAIRRIEGVTDARQYTIPVDEALDRVRSGENPDLTTREKHIRDCYVCVESGVDKEKIRNEIVNMPNYFSDYNTEVTFISKEEMAKKHSAMPHGGFVLRSGETSDGLNQLVEFSLKLDSNPEFTGSVLAAYARAACRLNAENIIGAKTVFDIAPAYLSIHDAETLRREYL